MKMDIKAFLKSKKEEHLLDGLAAVDDASLNAIRAGQKNAPDDYLEFLQEFGSGEIETVGFMLYNGLIEASDIFDEETAAQFEGVMIFGDDMQGRCVGFDKNDKWAVVEIDSADMSVKKLCDTFYLFVYNLLE
ncbi:SMI1/KNR4 family protein [Pseudomonas sp. W2Aug9]|uniref:SMI1/KNR4 family protein n=3 Tax=Pseudomonas TaxID=286 RepID=A0A5D3G4J2_9PSED|nr:SMI1/KNR4 family protein [Pseudomonas sp. W2Aug9]MCK3831753.1 SMI1/KNR4 family protein [Pseudomonas fluorescens]MCK3851366.1 SMI1/KNR4 family protein [Pseudomonas sp. W2Jun17]OPB34708.1 SMI1/KNR4 family protein [Pseudomonas fluorescens]TYK55030.1 SMI1/KNR4 family protein [Pseudomonas synxantha]